MGAINDRGQVVGLTSPGTFLINPEDTNGDGNPDLWNRDTNGDDVNDLMILLPSQGLYPGVIDVNAGGQELSGRILWTPDTPNGTTGSLTLVNPNDYDGSGLTTNSRSLNDSGQALGVVWWGNE